MLLDVSFLSNTSQCPCLL